MTTLTDGTVVTPTNATYTSSTDGQADLPSGATDVVLTDTTVLDVASSVNTISSGNIIISGVSQDLTSYTNGDLSHQNLDTAQDVGGTSVTVGTAVNLQSGTNGDPIILSNSDLSNVSVSIPDDTTVLAPAGWNGTITPPTASSDSSGSAPSGFSVGSTVIKVGSPSMVLLFDRPVSIVLTGVTGAVGYRPAGSSVWTQITNTCGTDYNNPTDPVFPGECAISNGTDTTILTYHFTTFGGLDPIPSTPAPILGCMDVGANNYNSSATSQTGVTCTYNGSLSFSGGGGGMPNPLPGETIATTAAGVTTTTAAPAQGQVLGAAVYNFTTDLTVGSYGADVTALQQFLISGGYSIPAGATGYFGSQTKSAVTAYQKAHSLPTTGYVGPLTLALLDKGAVATVPEGRTNLSSGQASAIIGFLQAFSADANVIANVKAALGL